MHEPQNIPAPPAVMMAIFIAVEENSDHAAISGTTCWYLNQLTVWNLRSSK
jgi:hypothetical protein